MVSSVPFVKALDCPISERVAVAPCLPTVPLSCCIWDVCNLLASQSERVGPLRLKVVVFP